MACYHPLTGYRTPAGTITFSRSRGYQDAPPITVSCGQCSGCRLERSRQWAVRCVHESQLHEDNCFITLTYDDAHLPEDESLSVRPLQLFMKKLRKRYAKKVKFFACGEYGTDFGRPHFHVCLFGHNFVDRRLYKKTECGHALCNSDELERLWSSEGECHGFATVGELTWESAAYTARYVMKKVTGNMAEDHYEHITRYGEVVQRKPEFVTMSRGGRTGHGIASGWIDKFGSDVYPDDFVVLNNKKFRPPVYYDGRYEIKFPSDLEKIKRKRRAKGRKHKANNTPERLAVRERVHHAKMKRLRRDME